MAVADTGSYSIEERLMCKMIIYQERQCTYKRNIEARSRNRCCHGKVISVTYFECVSAALVIQQVKRVRRIILSSVACLAVPLFPHYLINGTIFGRKKLLNMKCVF